MPNEIEKDEVSLLQEYEQQMEIARKNYKKTSGKLEFAFDSYEEECIKEEMELYKKEVKAIRIKIDTLATKEETL